VNLAHKTQTALSALWRALALFLACQRSPGQYTFRMFGAPLFTDHRMSEVSIPTHLLPPLCWRTRTAGLVEGRHALLLADSATTLHQVLTAGGLAPEPLAQASEPPVPLDAADHDPPGAAEGAGTGVGVSLASGAGSLPYGPQLLCASGREAPASESERRAAYGDAAMPSYLGGPSRVGRPAMANSSAGRNNHTTLPCPTDAPAIHASGELGSLLECTPRADGGPKPGALKRPAAPEDLCEAGGLALSDGCALASGPARLCLADVKDIVAQVLFILVSSSLCM
jgi:hypothetical protein